MEEQWLTDRERLEASASPAVLALADDFRDELSMLGWRDMSNRRALLLTMAQLAEKAFSPPGGQG